MPVKNYYPFQKGGYQGRPQIRGGRREGLGERGYYRLQEDYPRHEAWHEDNLYEDYGDNPNVGKTSHYGIFKLCTSLRLSWRRTKDASIARFLSNLNRDIVNQLELYPYTTYKDICHLATKIENQRKRIGFPKTNLPNSRSVVTKPQAPTYKSWPKKEDTPKVAFKNHSKPKVVKLKIYCMDHSLVQGRRRSKITIKLWKVAWLFTWKML
ncbi:hypothetical protein M9H77_13252 [Catharanthus roseus]|uniref:Uncharacterized protein n=1 Tax=Catharanthus roseus TaxID=4058 RepID=A0ACC0BJV8_CATRO|nr:hypothetical protein M9H77_13252 [Catharanthus roseus]